MAPPEPDGDTEIGGPLPPHVAYLKRLVTVLAVVMIAGVLVLIGAVVIRLNATPLPLPERITLPDGTTAEAVTFGSDWIGVVTQDDRILIFDRISGDLRQTLTIDPPS